LCRSYECFHGYFPLLYGANEAVEKSGKTPTHPTANIIY
jgi:hypothetical protein